MTTTRSSLVLLSGGMDSTVCLYLTRALGGPVNALGFDYGQTHKVELDYAARVAARANVPFHSIRIPVLGTPAPTGDSVVPLRNTVLLAHAVSWALRGRFDTVVFGACRTDHNDFPDCRPEFFNAFEDVVRASGYETTIETPLLSLDKRDVWNLAAELGIVDIIRDHTMSCYRGTNCGECNACEARNTGWAEHAAVTQ